MLKAARDAERAYRRAETVAGRIRDSYPALRELVGDETALMVLDQAIAFLDRAKSRLETAKRVVSMMVATEQGSLTF